MSITTTTPPLRLVEVSSTDLAPFAEYCAEDDRSADSRYGWLREKFGDDHAAALQYLIDDGLGLHEETLRLVPQTTFWLMPQDQTLILGTARLRRRLSTDLERWGGHIGYDIRPSQRRKGFGTQILALMKLEAIRRGYERVLLTCRADNVGSIRIIERNGGVLDDEYFLERINGMARRYWIDLSQIAANVR